MGRDVMDERNGFLLNVGREVRKRRVSFWSEEETTSIRLTKTADGRNAGLWFRTAGCTYDAQGGCIMCDYSNGPYTSSGQMISYIKRGLKSIPSDCTNLLVSPSGSMLDTKEVPLEALTGILRELEKTPFRIFFETRAETVNEDVIRVCKDILGNRFGGLYIGLESASPFVLKYCVNKQLRLSSVTEAIGICKRYGAEAVLNVLVGIPFLSSEESIRSAADTVNWGLNNGASQCDLFPIHIKCATPLSSLYEAGAYSPPSLWEILEVLNRLDESTWRKVGLSWYTSNGSYNAVSSPSTCPLCVGRVIECFDGFAQTKSPEWIARLNKIDCPCKRNWEKKASKPLPERILEGYRVLAERNINAWQKDIDWDAIAEQVNSDWAETGGCNAL